MFLLLKPQGLTDCTACLYLNGDCLEFSLGDAAATETMAIVEPRKGETRVVNAATRTRLRMWPMLVAAMLLLTIAGFVAIRLQRPAPSPPAPLEASLGLQVQYVNRSMVITWNRDVAALQDVDRAVLFIGDGTAEREIPLGVAELMTGGITYLPQSDSIRFRLEVFRQGKKRTAESLTVRSNPAQIWQVESVPPVKRQLEEVQRSPVQTEKPVVMATRDIATPLAAPPPRRMVSLPVSAPVTQTQQPLLDPPPAVVASATLPDRLIAVPPAAPPPPPQQQQSRPPTALQPRVATARSINSVVPPVVLHQVRPAIPKHISALLKEVTGITVNVTIDAEGRVVDATALHGREPQAAYLAELCRAAARQWRFKPARSGDRNVPSEMALNFRFGPEGSR